MSRSKPTFHFSSHTSTYTHTHHDTYLHNGGTLSKWGHEEDPAPYFSGFLEPLLVRLYRNLLPAVFPVPDRRHLDPRNQKAIFLPSFLQRRRRPKFHHLRVTSLASVREVIQPYLKTTIMTGPQGKQRARQNIHKHGIRLNKKT